MQLSWQPSFSLSRKPVKKSTRRRSKRKVSNDADQPQKFEFIAEFPVAKHGAKNSPLVTKLMLLRGSDSSAAECQATEASSDIYQSLASYSKGKEKEKAVSLCQKNMQLLLNIAENAEETRPSVETSLWDFSDISLAGSDASSSLDTIYGTTELSSLASIPPSMLYNSLFNASSLFLKDVCPFSSCRSYHSPLIDRRRRGILQNPLNVQFTYESV